MIVQDIWLKDYDWRATFFYAEDECLCDSLFDELEKIDCYGVDMDSIRDMLRKCERNTGFTYTNRMDHGSVVFIAPTDSAEQFMDTFDHEKGHLAKHIAMECEIDPWGEEYQYLSGEIARQTFPAAKQFLCDHCRHGRNI